MASRSTGVISVLGAAALFGTSGTSVALVGPATGAPGVAAGRLLVGSLGLLAVASRRAEGRRALLRLWRRPLLWAMGLAVAAYQVLFFVGVARTGVAVGTLASLALAPFLAGVLGWLMRQGAPGAVWVASTVLAVAGLVVLTASEGTTRDAWGILAALGAGASYAVYTVLGVRLSGDGESATHVLAASFAIAAAVCLPIFVMSGSWWRSLDGLALLLWLGLVTTTIGYLLFGVGLRTLQPGQIATFNLAEPVMATLLGVVVLAEPMGPQGWIGCVLILIALAVLGMADRGASASPIGPRDGAALKGTEP